MEKEKHLAGSKLRAFPAHPRLLPSSISLRPGCLPDISCLMLVSISSLHSPFPQTKLPPASFLPFSHSGLHFPTRIFFFHSNFDLQFSHKAVLGLFPFLKTLCGRPVFGTLWDIFRPLGPGPLFRVPSAPRFLWRPTCLFPFLHSSTFLLYSMGVQSFLL